MFDKVDYGYLGLALDVRSNILYYLTGSPLPGGLGRGEGSHLVTENLTTGRYEDHGQIVLDNGQPAGAEQALALGADGTVYSLTEIHRNGKRQMDLISFHP